MFVRLAGCLLSVCQRVRIRNVNPTLSSKFGVSGVVYALFLVRQNSIIAACPSQYRKAWAICYLRRASSEFLQSQPALITSLVCDLCVLCARVATLSSTARRLGSRTCSALIFKVMTRVIGLG